MTNRKQPEEKNCHWDGFLDMAVDYAVIGLGRGYGVEETLIEMMKRYTNGGLVGYEKEKIKLAKKIRHEILQSHNEYMKDLKECIKGLYESVKCDYETITNQNGVTFYPHSADYDDEVNNINNLKYEINKYERWINDLDRVVDSYEK